MTEAEEFEFRNRMEQESAPPMDERPSPSLLSVAGNAAWKGPWESGHERSTTTRDDVWYKPYDHEAGFEQHARDYLAWEVALLDQIKRDPTIRFHRY